MSNHYVEETDLNALLKGLDMKLGKQDKKGHNHNQDASGFFKFHSFNKVG